MNSKKKEDLGVKITDFGFSTFFDLKRGCKEMCGSPLYMAPEILKRDKSPYNQKVDIFFAIMVPAENAEGHLQTLARIAKTLSDKDVVKQIRKADSDQTLYDILQ